MIEVETPRNKMDLVRVKDQYGRKGTDYETNFKMSDLAGMKICDEVCGAKLRKNDMTGNYIFGLRTGKNIFSKDEDSLLYAVSLNLVNAFNHEIHIFDGKSLPSTSDAQEQLYFTVAKQVN